MLVYHFHCQPALKYFFTETNNKHISFIKYSHKQLHTLLTQISGVHCSLLDLGSILHSLSLIFLPRIEFHKSRKQYQS
jgi:hypothetical protein